MAINLIKGQRESLRMDRFKVGLGWDVNERPEEDFDLDVSAFMLGSYGRTPDDNHLVFYNSELRVKPDDLKKIVPASMWNNNQVMRHESRPVDPQLAVIGSIDDEDGLTSEDGDDETMDIDLSRVREDVKEIVICVSIYEYDVRRQNFGQVERAYVRIFREVNGREVEEYKYELTEDFSACACVEFCRLYRYNGEWKIQALGIGHAGGLEELVAKYV